MPSANNSTPTETAKSFLAGIRSRDKESMRSLCHPDATACLIRNGKPIHITVSDILKLIPEDSNEDEVSYDEVEHVDGDFATVWTPYRYYEDGKIHHMGSNNFCLWKSPEEGWIITAVQDIARPAEGVTNMKVIGSRDKD